MPKRKPSEPPAEMPLGPALDLLRRLWRLNHAVERLSSRMEKRLGVTAQQRFMIRCVGTFPHITAGQLAELLHVDPGTVSASLRRLEARALIERRRDPNDSRRVVIGLTRKGRALDVATTGTVEEAVQKTLQATSRAQRASTIAWLARLSDELDAAVEGLAV